MATETQYEFIVVMKTGTTHKVVAAKISDVPGLFNTEEEPETDIINILRSGEVLVKVDDPEPEPEPGDATEPTEPDDSDSETTPDDSDSETTPTT